MYVMYFYININTRTPIFGILLVDGSESRLGIDSTLAREFLEASDSISPEESRLGLNQTQSCNSVKTREFFKEPNYLKNMQQLTSCCNSRVFRPQIKFKVRSLKFML